jgi:hypothetical protein
MPPRGPYLKERDHHRHRLADAERRLASYRPRIGHVFAFEAELALKCDLLAEIEKDLAATHEGREEVPKRVA